jgi:hypothetical protein
VETKLVNVNPPRPASGTGNHRTPHPREYLLVHRRLTAATSGNQAVRESSSPNIRAALMHSGAPRHRPAPGHHTDPGTTTLPIAPRLLHQAIKNLRCQFDLVPTRDFQAGTTTTISRGFTRRSLRPAPHLPHPGPIPTVDHRWRASSPQAAITSSAGAHASHGARAERQDTSRQGPSPRSPKNRALTTGGTGRQPSDQRQHPGATLPGSNRGWTQHCPEATAANSERGKSPDD